MKNKTILVVSCMVLLLLFLAYRGCKNRAAVREFKRSTLSMIVGNDEADLRTVDFPPLGGVCFKWQRGESDFFACLPKEKVILRGVTVGKQPKIIFDLKPLDDISLSFCEACRRGEVTPQNFVDACVRKITLVTDKK